jgi:hypothetical protein
LKVTGALCSNFGCYLSSHILFFERFYAGILGAEQNLEESPASWLAMCRRRIINTHLLTDYAYFLAPGGILYTITDVEEVAVWMRQKLDEHPLFQPLSEQELEDDPAASKLASVTEEGKKVARNNGRTWRACFQRL